MYFTLNRDLVVPSTLGHAVSFRKGEKTYVPPEMHKIVMALGAQPYGDVNESEERPKVVEPADEETRARKIEEAFIKLAEENKPESFNAGGVPTPAAMTEALGWTPQNVEREKAWRDFKGQGAAAKAAGIQTPSGKK